MNTISGAKSKYNNPFASMKHKNFRYYWIGMCVSLIGTWMQNIAQPWLAYTLTKSPLLLSLIGVMQFLPIMIFSLYAGVFIDKFSKKKILIFTQSASLVITFVLAILVWMGKVQYWHILLMAMSLGIVNVLDMPSRQSFVIELVGKEDLMNAIALNSMAFNVARIIGPTLAGLVMGHFGIAVCFFANSISFGAVVISLFFIKPIQLVNKPKRSEKIFTEIKSGLKYIYKNNILFESLLVMTIVGIFAPNFNVLVPVFAKEILKQNETGFGILMSCMGAGSVIGAIYIATLSKSGPKKFVIYYAPLIIGTFLVLTGFSHIYFTTCILLALTGFFFITFVSSANSTLQLNSSNEYRGRVMSMYTLAFAGTTPIGNLYAGLFSEHFNAGIGFVACGAIILILMISILIYGRKHETLENN